MQTLISKVTEVINNADSGCESAGVYYTDTPCEDKVFLLSREELTSFGFNSSFSLVDTKRVKTASDFAKAKGSSIDQTTNPQGAWYWTRSPKTAESDSVWGVGAYGTMDAVFAAPTRGEGSVVPAIRFGDLATKPIYDAVNNTVEYGLFPQSVVTDPDIIDALENVEDPIRNIYYSYKGEYYVSQVANPYKENEYTFGCGDTIIKNQKYWFKAEPIVWNVLKNDTENNKRLIWSDKALDAGSYDDDSNFYADSNMRSYLNDTFLNIAFGGGSSNIKKTNVDNSEASTGLSPNEYCGDYTQDNVFLLSYAELENTDYGFVGDAQSSDYARIKEPTDYALARFAYMYLETEYLGKCAFWTRSPSNSAPNKVRYISGNGACGLEYPVSGLDLSIIPAMNITL